MKARLTAEACLPEDGLTGTLVGRAWRPGDSAGPAIIRLDPDGVCDITRRFATMADVLNADDPAAAVGDAPGERIGDLADMLANSASDQRRSSMPWMLAPCDLQALKASGVTFVESLLERVIEEQAHGDLARAEQIRGQVMDTIGGDLRQIRPGSDGAMQLKAMLIEQQAWSQYLEVGIGPDAEIFTKAQPMSAVGVGAEIGIHKDSAWNNPEPEVVLAVDAAGRTVGATLGNDVNLRDVEGRSALLLGRAKDNNASCAVGPFIRLFDDTFGIDDVRRQVLTLTVDGSDGYRLEGASSMDRISRDPLDLVGQTIGPSHAYPDGLMLFLGTMFAPVEDRSVPGQGFTHEVGDIVTIAAAGLGALVNTVTTSDRAPRWTFGAGALMRNLAARGLL